MKVCNRSSLVGPALRNMEAALRRCDHLDHVMDFVQAHQPAWSVFRIVHSSGPHHHLLVAPISGEGCLVFTAGCDGCVSTVTIWDADPDAVAMESIAPLEQIAPTGACRFGTHASQLPQPKSGSLS